MIIVPTLIHKDKIRVEVIFTPTEKQDPLFSPIRESLRTTQQTVKTVEETLTITKTLKTTDNPQTSLGQLVDTIRQKYCADIPEILEYKETTTTIKGETIKTLEPIYKTIDPNITPLFRLGEVKPIETINDDNIIKPTDPDPIKPLDPISEPIIRK